MRILLTFAGGNGHFQPLAVLARIASQRGHSVAFACQSGMTASVRAEGFVAYDTGGTTLLTSSTRVTLLELDSSREDRAVRHTFAGNVARERARALKALCAAWHPDVVVRDEVDFGAAVAAEQLGLPHASVLVIAAGVLVRHSLVADPIVYFTLGTIFNLESGDLFERVLGALADLPVSSVVTVGRELDPSQFGKLPRRIRLERYIPQASVLPRCSLVVSHAGSAEIRSAIADVLASPTYASAAREMRSEIQGLPPVEYGVDLLERLATTREPLHRAEAQA
ncbi:MAG: hypothetical protein JO020_27390 [Chloroflexi bacterium]|nr:hypothetical protein [Chloroflexota bacterium]